MYFIYLFINNYFVSVVKFSPKIGPSSSSNYFYERQERNIFTTVKTEYFVHFINFVLVDKLKLNSVTSVANTFFFLTRRSSAKQTIYNKYNNISDDFTVNCPPK